MKKIYIYVSLFLAVFLICYKINTKLKSEQVEVKENFELLTVLSNSCIKEIKEENEISKVLIYYPQTGYNVLDNEILNFVKNIYDSYTQKLNDINFEMPREAQLIINFESYEYKEYVSYVFTTSEDILMAHPDQHIYTINYDVKNDKIITIDELVNNNSNLLNVLSKYTYEELSKNKSIIEYDSFDDLKTGTLPIKENFKNIAFTKKRFVSFI